MFSDVSDRSDILYGCCSIRKEGLTGNFQSISRFRDVSAKSQSGFSQTRDLEDRFWVDCDTSFMFELAIILPHPADDHSDLDDLRTMLSKYGSRRGSR